MQGNEGPKGQKAQKAKNCKMEPGLALMNSLYGTLGKRTVFGNLWGRPEKLTPKEPKCKEMKAHKAKMQGNEGPQGQNARKWRPTRPKCKEMKAQKAKMQGNEGPQGQNERTWRSKGGDPYRNAPLKGKRFVWPRKAGVCTSPRRLRFNLRFGAQKAKMKGNEGPKGQNERKWRPKKPKIGKWSRAWRC